MNFADPWTTTTAQTNFSWTQLSPSLQSIIAQTGYGYNNNDGNDQFLTQTSRDRAAPFTINSLQTIIRSGLLREIIETTKTARYSNPVWYSPAIQNLK